MVEMTVCRLSQTKNANRRGMERDIIVPTVNSFGSAAPRDGLAAPKGGEADYADHRAC